MAPKLNLVLDQGTDFSQDIEINDDAGNPLDLSGYSAFAQFKKYYTANVAGHFTVSLSTGIINLSMNSASSSNISDGRYVYDIKLIDSDGKDSRPIEGMLTVTPQVSSNIS